MKVRRLLLVAIIAMALAVIQILPAAAYADASSYSASCSSFAATGTTNAPYVVLYAEYYNGSYWEYYEEIFPNTTGTYSHSFTFPAFAEGTLVSYYVWGSPTNSNEWDDEEYFYVELNCTNDVAGPGNPSGFALRTITCDVAVYNTPAGNPVGDARIKAGQTWYVNPTPVNGADGQQWTEIFAGGFTNGFIPTACVG